MYFSEQGNVDDDATLITIFLVHSIYSLAASCSLQSAVCSPQSAVCGLQSAVCKCHTPSKIWDGRQKAKSPIVWDFSDI